MSGGGRPTVRWAVGAGLAYALLAIVLTWPVLRDPAGSVLDTESLYGPAGFLIQRDINLTLWVLAWASHALITDPSRVLHGNAVYPTPWSMALSEHMLGNQPLFAPVYLATGNPILAYHWTLLATFVLAGLSMAAWVLYHTHDRPAAFVAGLLYAFAPFRLWQVGSLHVISTQWLPLVPLAFDLAFDGRGPLGALLLVLGLALSTGCSYYNGYAAFALAGAYGGALLLLRRDAWRRLAWPLVGTAVAVVAVGAASYPYILLQRQGILPRRSGNDYLSLAFVRLVLDGPLLLAARYVRFRDDGIPIFLGWVPLALGAAGVALWRRPPRAALVVAAAVTFVLTMGPTIHLFGRDLPLPYRVLGRFVPGFSAMRQPQRFAQVMSVVACAFSGLALARLRPLLAARGWRRLAVALPALAGVVAAATTFRPGLRVLPLPVGQSMPPAQRWLAAHGDGGVLLELPLSHDPPTRLYDESLTMYTSTAHWLPLVNGYTPYPPPSYSAVLNASWGLPDPAALARVRELVPVRWILVHRDRLPPDDRPRWDAGFAAAGLRRAADFGDDVVWELPAGGAGGSS